jgi:hypothetical protein
VSRSIERERGKKPKMKKISKERKKLILNLATIIITDIFITTITAIVSSVLTEDPIITLSVTLGGILFATFWMLDSFSYYRIQPILLRIVKQLSTILLRIINTILRIHEWRKKSWLRIKTAITQTYYNSLTFRIFLAAIPIFTTIVFENYVDFNLLPLLASDHPQLFTTQVITLAASLCFLLASTVMIILPGRSKDRPVASLSPNLGFTSWMCFIGATIPGTSILAMGDKIFSGPLSIEGQMSIWIIFGLILPIISGLLCIAFAHERILEHIR